MINQCQWSDTAGKRETYDFVPLDSDVTVIDDDGVIQVGNEYYLRVHDFEINFPAPRCVKGLRIYWWNTDDGRAEYIVISAAGESKQFYVYNSRWQTYDVEFLFDTPVHTSKVNMNVVPNGGVLRPAWVQVIYHDWELDPSDQEESNPDMGFCGITDPTAGEPVNLRTGVKQEKITDLRVNTPAGKLTFTRSFRQDKLNKHQLMGLGWFHNHNLYLEVDGSDMWAYLPGGGKAKFEPEGGNYKATAGGTSRIIVDTMDTDEYYTLEASNQSFVFNVDKQLRFRRWLNGEEWEYTYYQSPHIAEGKLKEVMDGYERKLQFTYIDNSSGFDHLQLYRVGDHTASGLEGGSPSGRYIEFGYVEEYEDGSVKTSPKALLETVKDVRGEIWSYQYYGKESGEDINTQYNFLVDEKSPNNNGSPVILKHLDYDSVTAPDDLGQIVQKLGGDGSNYLIEKTYDFQPNGENVTHETVGGLTTIHRFAGGVYAGPEDPAGNYRVQGLAPSYRPIAQQDANGNLTELDWNTDGKHLNQVKDALGNITNFGYNADDTLYRSLDAQNRRTLYLYESVNAPRQPTHIYVGRPFDSELLINGDMEIDNNWNPVGTPTTNTRVDGTGGTQVDAGNYARHVVTDAVSEGITSEAFDLAANISYLMIARIYSESGTTTMQLVDSGNTELEALTTSKTGEWETLVFVYVPSSTQNGAGLRFLSSGGVAEFYVDSVEVNELLRQQEYTYDSKGRTIEERLINPVDGSAVLQKTTRSYYPEDDQDPNYDANGAGLLKRVDQIDMTGGTNTVYSEYTYDSAGREIQVKQGSTFGACEAKQTTYDAAGNVLTSKCIRNIDDANDPVKSPITTYTYDSLGRQITITTYTGVTGLEQTTRTLYDALGRVVMTINNYIQQGSSEPEDWTWNNNQWEYASGQAVSHGSDNTQNTINTISYNNRGLVYSQRDVLGRVTLVGYDDAGRRVKIVQNASDPGYDAASDPDLSDYPTTSLSTEADEDVITSQAYDANGNVVKVVDPLDNVTFTAYDALNRVVRVITNAAVPSFDASNGLDSYPALSSDPDLDLEHTTSYDSLGRAIEMTEQDGKLNRTVYDSLGRPALTINNYVQQGSSEPEDWIWNNDQWEYASGQAVSHGANNDENRITQYAYDAEGRSQSTRNTLGHLTRYGYDGYGRQIITVTNFVPQNSSSTVYSDPVSWTWDGTNAVWRDDNDVPIEHGVDNDENLITTTVYNDDGQVYQTIDVLGNHTLHGYDTQGRRVRTIQYASASAGSYADDLGNYVISQNPDADLLTETSYDHRGQVIRTQRLKENRPSAVWETSLFGYDSLGRQVKVVRHASDPDYDLAADPDLSGYSASGETDEDQISIQSYNIQSQVLNTTDVNESQTQFVYDDLSRRVKTVASYVDQTTTPDQWLWQNNQWEYSAGNAVVFGDENDQNMIAETIYDKNGRVQSTRDVLGRVTYNIYDATGRVIRRISNYVAESTTPDEWEWREVSSVYAWRLSDMNDTEVERRSDPTNHPHTHDQNVISDTIYDGTGRVLQTIDVRGNLTRFVYDMLGRRVMSISNFVAQANPPEDWEWDAGDSRWEDGSGNAISRGADNDENGISFTYYDLAGRVDYTRDAVGLVTKNIYDKAGRRVRTIRNYVEQGGSDPVDWFWDETAGEWQYSVGNAVSHGADFDQNIISDTVYNNGGQVIATRDARGTVTAFTYDDAGRRLTITRAAGTNLATTNYTCYDKAGRVLRSIANYITDGVNVPDAQDGNGDWLFDPPTHGMFNDRNRITEFVYDKSDRRVRVTDPVGNVVETVYFPDGQVESITSKDVEVDGIPTDVATVYRYDKLRRRFLVVQNYVENGEDPENWVWDSVTDNRWEESDGTAIVHGAENDTNVIVRVARDIAGRMTSLRDPRGKLTTYTYDQLNRRLTLTNPLSQVWKSAYSDLSDGLTRTTMTYPGLSSGGSYNVEREFDPLGRLIKIDYGDLDKTDPGFAPDVDFAYDAAGNRSRMTEYKDAAHNVGRETVFSYDAARRLTQVDFDTDGDTVVEQSVAYEYDQGGLKTKMTLPGSLEVTYVYDAKGRLVSLTDWDDQPTSFFYDKANRHVGTARANGLTSDYLHDRAGRLLRVRHRAGQNLRGFFEYQVDARGNRVSAVERQVTTANGTLYGKDAGIVSYDAGTWTDDGSFKKSEQFSARMTLSGWTGDEALMTIGTGSDHSIFDVYIGGSFWQSFDGYSDSAGERVIHIPVNPSNTPNDYIEIRNRADKNRQSSGYVFRFKSLQGVNVTETDREIAYTYDALSRLVEADYDSGTNVYEYSYDLAGNRTKETIDAGTPTFSCYNEINQLVGQYTSATDCDTPDVTLTYDANGNLTNDGANSYTWDRANRLLGNGTVSYAYDGLGNRVARVRGLGVTEYLLDLQPGLAKVLAQTESGTVRYLHGPRGIHAEENNSGVWTWMLQDGLGSVRGMVGSDLSVNGSTGIQNYTPYGEPQETFGSTETPFGFTGEQYDPYADDALYLRARHYLPGQGVFASLDPFEGMMDRAMSLNGYSWVEGNPVMNTDPSGHFSLSATGLTNIHVVNLINAGSCQSSSLPSASTTFVNNSLPQNVSSSVCCAWLGPIQICMDCDSFPPLIPTFEPPNPEDALEDMLDLIDEVGDNVFNMAIDAVNSSIWFYNLNPITPNIDYLPDIDTIIESVRGELGLTSSGAVSQALTQEQVTEALDTNDTSLNWVVRGGLSQPDDLIRTWRQHVAVPGLYGVSAQYNPGSSIYDLACTAPFPNGSITISTSDILSAIAVQLVASPGRGYHHTMTIEGLQTLPSDIAEALSRVFVAVPNPCRASR